MPPFPSGTGILQLLAQQGQRRAALTQQLGQIAAETQARNGQIWGNTLAQLGQLPMQIYQQRAADQEMKLRQAQEQRLAQQLQDQEEARNQATVQKAAQASILSAYTTQNPDGSVTVNGPAIQAKMAEIAMPLEDQASMMKYVGSLNQAIKAGREQRANEMGDLANDLLTHTKGPITPEGAGLTYSLYKQNGLTSPESDTVAARLLSQVPPGADMREVLTKIRDAAPKYRDQKPVNVAPGGSLVNPATGEPLFQAPERPVSVAPGSSLMRPDTGEIVGTSPESPSQLDAAARSAASAAETARHNKAMEGIAAKRLAQGGGAAGAAGPNADVKETVQGIKDGTLPPVLPSRGSKEYLALMAEAHRQGVDLSKANQDWTATQRYLGTLNGAQQTRLRQAISFTRDSIPQIKNLVNQWDAGNFPLLNKANLTLAKQGAMGPKAASIASRLDAQIADLSSELGTVYKGGNSSTDESLRLAAENLKSDWSKKVALDALDQIDKNLTIRENSMKNAGVAGVSDNAYEPKTAPVKRYNPATGKVE